MAQHGTDREGTRTQDLVLDIVATLSAEGVDTDEFTLHEYVDVEAVEAVLDCEAADPMVVLTVEGVRFAVTPDGTEVL